MGMVPKHFWRVEVWDIGEKVTLDPSTDSNGGTLGQHTSTVIGITSAKGWTSWGIASGRSRKILQIDVSS
jgi:hypothetical protein